MQWGSESRWLWLQSFERTRNHVLRLDTIKRWDVAHFASDVQNFWAFAITPDGKTMVVGGETGRMPPNLMVIRDGGKPRTLTDLNPQVAGLQLGDVREVEWKST